MSLKYICKLLKEDEEFSHLKDFELEDRGYTLVFHQYEEPVRIKYELEASRHDTLSYMTATLSRTHIIKTDLYMPEEMSLLSSKIMLKEICKNFLTFDHYYLAGSGQISFSKYNIKTGISTYYSISIKQSKYYLRISNNKTFTDKSFDSLNEVYKELDCVKDEYILSNKQALINEINKKLISGNIPFEFDEETESFIFSKSFDKVVFDNAVFDEKKSAEKIDKIDNEIERIKFVKNGIDKIGKKCKEIEIIKKEIEKIESDLIYEKNEIENEGKVFIQIKNDHYKNIKQAPRTHFITINCVVEEEYFDLIVRNIIGDIFRKFFKFEAIYLINTNQLDKRFWDGRKEMNGISTKSTGIGYNDYGLFMCHLGHKDEKLYSDRKIGPYKTKKEVYEHGGYYD